MKKTDKLILRSLLFILLVVIVFNISISIKILGAIMLGIVLFFTVGNSVLFLPLVSLCFSILDFIENNKFLNKISNKLKNHSNILEFLFILLIHLIIFTFIFFVIPIIGTMMFKLDFNVLNAFNLLKKIIQPDIKPICCFSILGFMVVVAIIYTRND